MGNVSFHIKPADIVIAVSVLWIFLGTYFIGLPQSTALGEKTRELATKEQEVARLESRTAALTSLGQKLESYSAEVLRLSVALPADPQVVEAMIQLQTITERAGVATVEVKPSRAQEGELPVNVTLRGNYQALVSFLRELDGNLRPVTVQSFSFARSTDGSQDLTATFQLGFAYAGVPQTTGQ